MKKLVFLIAFALLFSLASASTVTRSFSATTIAPSTDLTVTLAVAITGNETYYAIDEIYPAGWTMKSAGTGATDQPGHIKWVTIQAAASTTLTYVLTAPATTGTHTFSGTYMFELMTAETPIAGATQVTVSANACPNGAIAAGSTCLCGGTAHPEGGYCCNNVFRTTAQGACPAACPDGNITSACICAGTERTTGYCCGNQYRTTACPATCASGAITSACTCGGTEYSTGYCCAGVYSATGPCTATCPNGQITSNCLCGGTAHASGYCCSSTYQATTCAQCTADANCSTGQKCCSNSCVTPACDANSDCTAGQICQNAGACNASCVTSTVCATNNDCTGGKICCSSACKLASCGAQKSCSANYECANPDSCTAKCNYIPPRQFAVSKPACIVLGEEFDLAVKDKNTSNVVAGATVTYAAEDKTTGVDGTVDFTSQKYKTVVTVKKTGYKNETVRLIVKSACAPGSGGGTANEKFMVTVSEAVYANEPFDVLVTDMNGNPLAGATIKYGAQTMETDETGMASLMGKLGVSLVQVKTSLGSASARVTPKSRTATDANQSEPELKAPNIDLVTIVLVIAIVIGVVIFIKGRQS